MEVNKENLILLMKDVKKVAEVIPDIVSNADNSIIIIGWIADKVNQIQKSLEKIIELNSQEEK